MKQETLKFGYTKTKSIYVQRYLNGKWEKGHLISDDMISIHSMSTSLHYGQEAYEGLKAYRRKDGNIQLFRVRDNARRFQKSCERILMPKLPVEDFYNAVYKTVEDNHEHVPPYGENQTLYIRPVMIGVGANLGLIPSNEYLFMVIVTPVAAYFKGASKGIRLVTSDYDRVAPKGTGQAKVGGNYAGTLYPKMKARQAGFDDCIFLDPLTHTKIEEVGSANFFAITKDFAYVSPVSDSILKGITNDSLKWIAKHKLNMKVIEKDVHIDEINNFKEANACGTAALISPIDSITHKRVKYVFPTNGKMGEQSQKLYDTLFGIQTGDIEDPNNWTTVIKVK